MGVDKGQCAICLPGAFSCDGRQLKACADDGQDWMVSKECETEALCNATVGDCTSDVCYSDTRTCDGDILMGCNDDLSGFEELDRCGEGLCDAINGQCDICVPGTKSCDGNDASTCDSEGQGFDKQACPARCTGAGICVDCVVANDCPAPKEECTEAVCLLPSGDCGAKPRQSGYPCTGGTCNDSGTCVQSATDAGSTDTGTDSGSADAGPEPHQTLPPVTDYSLPGPFSTVTISNTGPNEAYTVFRPETLGQDGFMHSPVVFGPGVLTSPSNYASFLRNVASHGFVVIAVNSLSGSPGSATNRTAMIEGLDWIIAQNDVSGVYQGKLEVTRAIAMGYSIGATTAVDAGDHANVITTISIHGHTITSALHGPLFLITGTEDDVQLQQGTFDSSTVQTFLATLEGAAHMDFVLEAGSNGGGLEGTAVIAWLRFWINNDTGAQNYFYGADCVLCGSPWVNPQRKNWN